MYLNVTNTYIKTLSPSILRFLEPKITAWVWFLGFCCFYRHLIFWNRNGQCNWNPVKCVSATIQEHYGCNSTKGFSQNDPNWWNDTNYHNKLNCTIATNAFAISSICIQHWPWEAACYSAKYTGLSVKKSLFQYSSSDLQGDLSVLHWKRDNKHQQL